jgi:CheY-like chemotaxis protein
MEDYRPLALVVEDDDNQRALLSILLEESEMEVLECDSAEAAISVLDRLESVLPYSENFCDALCSAALRYPSRSPALRRTPA